MKKKLILIVILTGMSNNKLAIKPTSLDGDFILNPNKVTPLSGEYRLAYPIKKPITILVKGKTQEMDIIHKGVYTNQSIPIHGLYPNYTNTVILSTGRLVVTNTIITKKSKYKPAIINIDKLPTPNPKNQDIYFVNQSEEGEPANDRHDIVGYDRKGDVRYIAEVQKLHYMMATNNQILIRNNDGIQDLLGNKIVDYKAQNNQLDIHHDSIQVADRHIVLANSRWGIEDRLIEMDSHGNFIRDLTFGSLFRDIVTNKKEVDIMNQFLFDEKNIYMKNGKKKGIDWAHANSLVYDKSKDMMYISLRHQGIIAVKYSTWKLIWWLTDDTLDTEHEGVPNRGLNILDLPSLMPYRVLGDAVSNGPRNQHALFLFKNNSLGMFDNAGDGWERDNPSRYLEYKIIKKNNTWVAKKTREIVDSQLYSQITSDIDLLENGDLLIGWGVPGIIREYSDKNEITFEMKAYHNWYFYRIDKMPLYPYSSVIKRYSLDANEISRY